MQNKSIVNTLVPVVSTTPTTPRAPENKVPDQQFTRMLSRQMNDRAAAKSATQSAIQPATKPVTKPAEAPRTVAAKSPDMAEKADTAEPATAASTTSATASKADADKSVTDTKDKSDDSAPAQPASSTDAALLASAAIMALVANASAPATTPVSAALATTLFPAKVAKTGIEPDLLQNSARTDPSAVSEDGPTDAAVKELITKGAGEFANVLQSARTSTVDQDLALVRLAEQPVAGNGLQPAQQTALTMAAPAGVHPGNSLAPQVNNSAWDQALGQRMVWMVAGAEQSATLTLNPPDLGPLQVVLNVSNGQADASFFAAQPEVRQALEAALPKLREMLGDAGISLGQANVSSGSPHPQSNSGQRDSSAGRSSQSGVAGTAAVSTHRVTSSGNGMVDTFA